MKLSAVILMLSSSLLISCGSDSDDSSQPLSVHHLVLEEGICVESSDPTFAMGDSDVGRPQPGNCPETITLSIGATQANKFNSCTLIDPDFQSEFVFVYYDKLIYGDDGEARLIDMETVLEFTDMTWNQWCETIEQFVS